MSSHYSRQQKPRKSGGVPTQHIKTGFTAFQKSIALIGSILSIIVATITITRALQPASDTKTDNTSKESSNTIVKIIEKDSSQGNQSHKDSSENSDETKTFYRHLLPPLLTTIQPLLQLQCLIHLQQLKEHNFPMQQELRMPILDFLLILKDFKRLYNITY